MVVLKGKSSTSFKHNWNGLMQTRHGTARVTHSMIGRWDFTATSLFILTQLLNQFQQWGRCKLTPPAPQTFLMSPVSFHLCTQITKQHKNSNDLTNRYDNTAPRHIYNSKKKGINCTMFYCLRFFTLYSDSFYVVIYTLFLDTIKLWHQNDHAKPLNYHIVMWKYHEITKISRKKRKWSGVTDWSRYSVRACVRAASRNSFSHQFWPLKTRKRKRQELVSVFPMNSVS